MNSEPNLQNQTTEQEASTSDALTKPNKRNPLDIAIPATILTIIFTCVGGFGLRTCFSMNRSGKAMDETRINMVLDNDQRLFYHDSIAFGPNGAVYDEGRRYDFAAHTCHIWKNDTQETSLATLSDQEWLKAAQKALESARAAKSPPAWLQETKNQLSNFISRPPFNSPAITPDGPL
jgi:hypothetical protein